MDQSEHLAAPSAARNDGGGSVREMFGKVADEYDRGRPGYPGALITDVLALCDPSTPRVLEVGAGTGRATRLLAAAGMPVVAIEPSSEMAAIAERELAHLRNVEVSVGKFEEWSPDTERFGLVAAAQAWHWVSPGVRTERAHGLLSDRGALAVFWTHPCWEQVGCRTRLVEIHQQYAPTLVGRGPWFPGYDGPARGEQPHRSELDGLFGDLEVQPYPWSQAYDADAFLDLMRSFPEYNFVDEANRGALFDSVAEEIQREGGSLTVEFETVLYSARRVS